VDFSLLRLFLVPTLGLGLGAVTVLGFVAFVSLHHDGVLMLAKGAVATSIYLSISFLLEGREYLQNARLFWDCLVRSHRGGAGEQGESDG
jgi:hypothetical protein